MKMIQTILVIAVLITASGCATGPIRRSTLGQYSYATVEWTKKADPVLKPLAAVGGVISDTVITAGDTVFVPITSVPIAALSPAIVLEGANFKNDPIHETVGRFLLIPVVFVITYPVAYPVSLYFMSYGGGFDTLPPVDTTTVEDVLGPDMLGSVEKKKDKRTTDSTVPSQGAPADVK